MPEPIVAYWKALLAYWDAPLVWITAIGLAVLAFLLLDWGLWWWLLMVLAALLLAVAIWWAWWRLPKQQVAQLALKIRDPKDRADVEDNYRKTIGQAIGGVAVLLGAVLAYLQFSGQQRAAHDLLISNQVSKGFEQLGSEKFVVRLGGIYALEGVMNASDHQYYQPVLEALTAFVREGTSASAVPAALPPTDIQAALTVIGRREAGWGGVDLTKANIAGAHLTAANLPYALLVAANLTDATLTDASLDHADLRGANLTGTDLTGADLTDAYLLRANLTRANLTDANLAHAYLYGANLTCADLRGAKLGGADLTGANLTGAILVFPTGLNQKQLNVACGSDAKLPPGLTLKPCPPQSPPPPRP
jgi:uncharacterized protein YjbI with pentapeptide repeats